MKDDMKIILKKRKTPGDDPGQRIRLGPLTSTAKKGPRKRHLNNCRSPDYDKVFQLRNCCYGLSGIKRIISLFSV